MHHNIFYNNYLYVLSSKLALRFEVKVSLQKISNASI